MSDMSVEVDEMRIESSHRVRSTLLVLMVAAMITLGLRYLVGGKD
jgi:hypothetical protein